MDGFAQETVIPTWEWLLEPFSLIVVGVLYLA